MEQESLIRHKIVVLNAKGGSGKTTVATGLASWFSTRGLPTALMDHDPLNLSIRWLSKRPEEAAHIHGVAATCVSQRMTRAYQMRIPRDTRIIIVDTPAAIPRQSLFEYIRDADVILCPVGPSELDIYSASLFVEDLLKVASSHHREGRIGLIANRVRKGTIAYRNLKTFLERQPFPLVSTLRDSQNYLHCADAGLGLHELEGRDIRADRKAWNDLSDWLAVRCGFPGPPLKAVKIRRRRTPAKNVDKAAKPPSLYVVPQGKA
jgi:chromosome partitioning protein